MLWKEPSPGSSSQRTAFAGLLLLLGCLCSWLWLPHPLIFPLQPQLVQGEQLGFLCASRSWQEHEGGFELGFELLTPLMWCWEAPRLQEWPSPAWQSWGLVHFSSALLGLLSLLGKVTRARLGSLISSSVLVLTGKGRGGKWRN